MINSILMLFKGMFCENIFQADQYYANVTEFLNKREFDDKKKNIKKIIKNNIILMFSLEDCSENLDGSIIILE